MGVPLEPEDEDRVGLLIPNMPYCPIPESSAGLETVVLLANCNDMGVLPQEGGYGSQTPAFVDAHTQYRLARAAADAKARALKENKE